MALMDANLLLPTTALFKVESKSWPPPPKVKAYDQNGVEKPRVDIPAVAELKRGKFLLFDALNATDIESISSVESQRPEINLLPSIPAANEIESAVTSLISTHDSISKMLANESGGLRGKTEISALGSKNDGLMKTKQEGTEKKREQWMDEAKKQKKKATTKQIPRMSRLVLWEYLKSWDKGSNSQRIALIHKFLEDYTARDPLDLDLYLSKGGSLIFTRFLVGMQISFQCKKPVAHHFLALGIFIKSLNGERYTYEFGLAGGFQTSFEVLRVHEMTNHDKMHAFHFLCSIVDGQGGCSAKRLLCSDTSYLECIVDCLTMCQNVHVINEAKQFLQNLCIGNTSKNLVMISKYIISLLPCDFNPQIQAMACHVLQGIINQIPDVAGSCCTLVVDVLKSNYDDALVDVGNVCLAIMGTPTADDLLIHLIEAAQPYNLLENLMSPGIISQTTSNEFSPSGETLKSVNSGQLLTHIEHDPYFRLQYGAIYILSYMVKNQPEVAEWMIERGVIGSLLSGIGTTCYNSVQLEAIRLLLLLHELSPDCSMAISVLLPQKLLTALLDEHEDVLQYVTAVMCSVLVRLGTRVQRNWKAWFLSLTLDGEEEEESAADGVDLESEESDGGKKGEDEDEPEEGEQEEEEEEDPLYEIDTLVELLEQSLTEPFMTIMERMKLIFPDPGVIDNYREGTTRSQVSQSSTRQTMQRFQEKPPGEDHIQVTEALEPFRKYLRKDNVILERVDEFEKYYAAKFIMASEAQIEDMDTAQLLAIQDAEQALKTFKDPFKVGENAEDGEVVSDHSMNFEDKTESEQDMLNL